MAASSLDKITQARGASGNPVVTTVSAARATDATSLTCTALTNWPTDTQVHFITYTKNSDGTKNSSSQLDWKGTVSSSTSITSMVLKNGTDGGNAIGDFVEMGPTASWGEDLYDGLTNEHNSAGAHTDITADSITMNSGGSVDFSNAKLASTDIADAAVTYAKLASSIFSGQLTTYTNPGSAGGTSSFYYGTIGGLKVLFGETAAISTSSTGATKALTLPSSFFSSVYHVSATASNQTSDARSYASVSSASTSSVSLVVTSVASITSKIMVLVIGV